MRLALGLASVLLLAACEKCDSCKDGTCKDAKPTSPAAAGAKAAGPEQAEPPHVKPDVAVAYRGTGARIELSVWEMHCAGCSADIEKAFGAVPGVKSVTADYASSKVTVEVADAAK